MPARNPRLIMAARLRQNEPTPAASILWAALRSKGQIALKLSRQHMLGLSCIDFYYVDARWVIEIDGDMHDHQVDSDHAGTQQLENYGYKVIKIIVEMILNNISNILDCIMHPAIEHLKSLTSHTSNYYRNPRVAKFNPLPLANEKRGWWMRSA